MHIMTRPVCPTIKPALLSVLAHHVNSRPKLNPWLHVNVSNQSQPEGIIILRDSCSAARAVCKKRRDKVLCSWSCAFIKKYKWPFHQLAPFNANKRRSLASSDQKKQLERAD